MRASTLTTLIAGATVLGAAAGYVCNVAAPDAEAARQAADLMSLPVEAFLRLVRMIIAPLVFASVVAGIAGMGSGRAVRRIALKAVGWFACASLVSLLIGMGLANLPIPGFEALVGGDPAAAGGGAASAMVRLDAHVVLAHLFPASVVDAMARNEILQIVVFAAFFGVALHSVRDVLSDGLVNLAEETVIVVLRITNYVMLAAPLAVFGAIAAAVTTQGPRVLLSYGGLIGAFYAGLAVLWLVMVSVGYAFLRRPLFKLLRLLRDPIMLGFSTASSEAAFPRLLEQLDRFGVPNRVTGLVLPLGYSFNLDGSMIYQAFATLLIARAYHVQLDFWQQLGLLLVMMLLSKGIAGVPRAALAVVATALPMIGVPEGAVLVLIGIDQFFDMGRTATNVLGNGIATAVIARSEAATASSSIRRAPMSASASMFAPISIDP